MASFSRIRSSQANYDETKVIQIDHSIRGLDRTMSDILHDPKCLGCNVCDSFFFSFLLIGSNPNLHKVFLLFLMQFMSAFRFKAFYLLSPQLLPQV